MADRLHPELWGRQPRGGDPIWQDAGAAGGILRDWYARTPAPPPPPEGVLRCFVEGVWRTGVLRHKPAGGQNWLTLKTRRWDDSGSGWGGDVAPPAPVPWTPAMMANVFAWYSADNPANTIEADLITVLADRGPGHYDASIVSGKTTGSFMNDTLNGRMVLKADYRSGVFMAPAENGGDDLARSANAIAIYCLHRVVSKESASYPAVASTSFGAGTATLQMAMMRSQTGNAAGSISLRTRPGTGDGALEMIDNTNYSTDWVIAGGERNWAARTGTIWVNGTQMATGPMVATQVSGNNATSLVIGSYTVDNVDPWIKNIAETVFVRGGLSLADRLRLDGYLAWEWGLQANLPVDHPYKSARPMVAA